MLIYPISSWSYKELICIVIEQTPNVWYVTSQRRMLNISMRQRPRCAQAPLYLIAQHFLCLACLGSTECLAKQMRFYFLR
jgi:hypothetical protein